LSKADLVTMFQEACDMLGQAVELLPLPAVVLLLEVVREAQADLIRSVQQTHDKLLNKKVRQRTIQTNGDCSARTRFFSFLMADANNLLNPLHGQLGVQDMTRP
jgi:hypothetical protein